MSQPGTNAQKRASRRGGGNHAISSDSTGEEAKGALSSRHRYQGHVPGVAFSFGIPYGTATLKYFQDHRNAALEKSRTVFSKGGHFPTLFSSDPNLVLSKRSHTQDRWLHTPSYTRFNLDSGRSAQLTGFYQSSSEPREEVAPFKSISRELEDLPEVPLGEEGHPPRAAEERLLL
ncbi:protein FAM166C isoform X4 [Neofelis nebulosa]|uniref:protein FAM166C isoform X4 n=1 Tax=Neofelis nebulosa TaxID=61452 RepID=UPI00272D6508|nr:protein FAM166C isoform X4 [Neofelis nebulosa]